MSITSATAIRLAETVKRISDSDKAGFSPLWHVWFDVALFSSLGVAQVGMETDYLQVC